MAIVAPPTNNAAARPIRADLVMIFLRAGFPNHRKNIRQVLVVIPRHPLAVWLAKKQPTTYEIVPFVVGDARQAMPVLLRKKKAAPLPYGAARFEHLKVLAMR
jgi:hypothetical protein